MTGCGCLLRLLQATILGVINMKTVPLHAGVLVLSCWLTTLTAVPLYAQNAQSVRLGEAALTYAAGSIRQDMPVDGVVNVITGDNQITGNRMMIGWSGTDTLYLKLKNPGEAALGDLYTIYRRSRKVFHPRTKEYLGYVITRLGVVKIIQVDPALVLAQVVRSYGPFSPGDPVVRFTPPTTDEVGETPSPVSGLEGMVVDLQSDKNMSLVAQGNVVYLDRGHEDGVRAGDLLEVLRTGAGLPERKIGVVKILSTEARTATAVLHKAWARVLVGDRVRSNQVSSVEVLPGDDAVPQVVTAVASTPTSKDLRLPDGESSRHPRSGATLDLDELAGKLEFESGQAKVTAEGEAVLRQLATQLKDLAGHRLVRIEGHSDNMEIGPSLKGQFPTNWDLSKARAAGIVQYLVEQGGLDSAKLTAVGYGATRPLASNASETDRRKNRRIEVVLYSPDAEPVSQPVSSKVPEVLLGSVDAVVGSDDRVVPGDSAASDEVSHHVPAAADGSDSNGSPGAEPMPSPAGT